MTEIQRYWVEGRLHVSGVERENRASHVVHYSEHLADKTAALEAQAEEHERHIGSIVARWSDKLAAASAKHAAELDALRGEVEFFRELLKRASACLDLRSWRHLYDEIDAALTPEEKPNG